MSANANNCFFPADILLPDFLKTDPQAWSVIACDQFTSEPAYWERVAQEVGDKPSTLNLILPEVYLPEQRARLPKIKAASESYEKNILSVYPNSMIYTERTQTDGRVRTGIIGMIDLEKYDFKPGNTALIRATEATVKERIPPRVAIRTASPIEAPHAMLLCDDDKKTVIEPLASKTSQFKKLYDFDLMEGGGHIKGWLLDENTITAVCAAIEKLIIPMELRRKYHNSNAAPMLFAVGDGNHSLASAKVAYAQTKIELGEDALEHPSRYALVELVNLHSEALSFEPIYRVMFGINPDDVVNAFYEFISKNKGKNRPTEVKFVSAATNSDIYIKYPCQPTAVGTVQDFIDTYIKDNPTATVDYIHGNESLYELARTPGAIGFMTNVIKKSELFEAIINGGLLPRKCFSMGQAKDKRYYLECRNKS